MTKIDDLRRYLLARIPALKRNPDQLFTFVEKGNIQFYRADNYSHQYQMPVRIVITDWRGDTDELVITLLEWLNVREPRSNPEQALQFDAQVVDSESLDIAFNLDITETVIVKWDGVSRTIEHVLPEPPMEMDNGVDLQLFVNGPAGGFTLPHE